MRIYHQIITTIHITFISFTPTTCIATYIWFPMRFNLVLKIFPLRFIPESRLSLSSYKFFTSFAHLQHDCTYRYTLLLRYHDKNTIFTYRCQVDCSCDGNFIPIYVDSMWHPIKRELTIMHTGCKNMHKTTLSTMKWM